MLDELTAVEELCQLVSIIHSLTVNLKDNYEQQITIQCRVDYQYQDKRTT